MKPYSLAEIQAMTHDEWGRASNHVFGEAARLRLNLLRRVGESHEDRFIRLQSSVVTLNALDSLLEDMV